MPQRRLGAPANHVIVLPSDGARVWGPGELGYWEETQILSKAQRTEVDPRSTRSLTVIDNALFEYTLIHAWLEGGGWDIFDEDNQPIEVTTDNIDKVFRGQDGRKDRQHIMLDLVGRFFPEMLLGQMPAPDATEQEKKHFEQVTEGNGGESQSERSESTGSTLSLRELQSQPTP